MDVLKFVILFLGVCSVSYGMSDDEGWLDKLAAKCKESLENLSKKVANLHDNAHESLDEFFENIKEVARKVEEVIPKMKGLGSEAADLVELFQKTVNAFEMSKRSGKDKRVVKEVVEHTKHGISLLGKAMQGLFDALKPVKGNLAGVALDIQRAVDKAVDKLLDAVIAAG